MDRVDPHRIRPDEPTLFRRALRNGVADVPGEQLSPFDRRLLLLRLSHLTVRQIADHTGWTQYTVTRLLGELGIGTH